MAITKKATSKSAAKTKTADKTSATAKPTASRTARKPAAQKSCKGLFIGIIVIAVVAVVAAIICFICFGKPNLVGTYQLTGIERDGEDQSSSIDVLKEFGMDATMELKGDKTGELDLFGEKSEVSYDDKSITINGSATEYTYKDGKLSLEQNGAKLIFTKNK